MAHNLIRGRIKDGFFQNGIHCLKKALYKICSTVKSLTKVYSILEFTDQQTHRNEILESSTITGALREHSGSLLQLRTIADGRSSIPPIVIIQINHILVQNLNVVIC